LGRLGSAARDALPEVKKNLENENADTRLASLQAFTRIEGDSARSTLPVLTDALSDAAAPVRHFALESLAQQGQRARRAEEEIFARLSADEDRGLALAALRSIRTENVDLLTKALADKEWEVRLFSAERLGDLGARSASALPALREGQEDEEEMVSRAIGRAIRQIERASRQ